MRLRELSDENKSKSHGNVTRSASAYGDTKYVRCVKLLANGRNNSQDCSANNVGSCCVRVGSGVQTDATTPNIVKTGSVHRGKNAVNSNETMCHASAWPQECWKSFRKSCANGSKIIALGSCLPKSLTGLKFCATKCNRVCKRTQHVTSKCWPTMFRPFARGFIRPM